MRLKNVASICLIVAGLCAGVAACQKREQNQKLTIVVREGLEADGIRKLAEVWSERTHIPTQVQALGRDNYQVNVTNDLLSSNPRYDVDFFPSVLVADMASRDRLSPIEGWSPASDKDLLSFASYQGKTYGLPCDISSFFMYYRKDVVKKLPNTWNELLKVAPLYTKSLSHGVPTAYGLAFGAKAGEDLLTGFLPLLWSYGGYLIKDGKVGLDTPGGIQAATMLHKLVTSGATPPDIQSWEVTKVFDELQRGTVAIAAPEWNALYPLIKNGNSSYRGEIEIAPIPGVREPDGSIRRVNFEQTWVLVKSREPGMQSQANSFILFATSREGGRIYADTAHGNPARVSLLSDQGLQKLRPEFPLLLESIRDAESQPAVPFYPSMSRIINAALSQIISGERTPASAMKEAARGLRALMQ